MLFCVTNASGWESVESSPLQLLIDLIVSERDNAWRALVTTLSFCSVMLNRNCCQLNGCAYR